MEGQARYLLERLRQGEDFTLYRGKESRSHSPVLALAVSAEQPSPRSLRRLEHEFAFAQELDPVWAAQPLALMRHQGRATLILADPGGEPLDQVIEASNGPVELTRFLRIAIGLASALRQVHRRGLVHKDIKPENALVDEAGRAWLTGFGIASRLPRERLAPAPPETIAGTLAYMAPEQTGRMNRSVDSRSDLYALGVTLYEMATGALPFTASDATEWIHCHIARTPMPPADRCAVPEPVSAIVMRLLAKNAEERYQTAAGLEADLRRCLSDWRAHGRIDPFPLGADDVSEHLRIPEKLYGRERDVDALLAAFDRVATRGAVELVLVSGYSGVGKSSVVNELHKALVPPRGLFAAGKFDQYKRDVPYATLAQAFQGLVRQILSKSEAELQTWREALREALDANGRLIIDLIPELELVIGPQPPLAELAPQDAQRRFQAVLRRFIGIFADAAHPLALFLDDLQWLDAATLDLIEDLVTQGDVRGLLLIGAYRDNEVDTAHPLTRKLDEIRRAGAAVTDITLAPLSYDHLARLISDALHCEPEGEGPFVRLVREKTGGNPFFAIQFLQTLADEGHLVFDHAEARWYCDLDRIQAQRYTDNVVDLMVAKLARLPAETQITLRQLACVGAGATFELLETVCQTSREDLHRRLWEAARAGLVIRSGDAYAFQHDRIQEAAYSRISEAERTENHLRIGRLLLANTPPARREEAIFEIVGQFNRGSALITSQDEREQLARLNLTAGNRAKSAAAYSTALTYFAEGRTLLAEDCLTQQYPLTFELELHRAECKFLTGELASAEEWLEMLASVADNSVDQAAVTCLRADLFNILGRPHRTVAVCLDYLRQVGLEVSPHPTDEAVRQENERLWRRLGTRPIEDLIDLPLMEDASARATMDVLAKVAPYAQTTDKNLNLVLRAHMVNLSIEHGASAAACVGYALIGQVLAEDGRYQAAGRFGQLSLDLVDKRGLDGLGARVYLLFAVSISPFLQHLRSSRTLLLRTLEEAIKLGDLVYAGYCRAHIITNSTVLGRPLHEVEQEAMDGVSFARKTGAGFLDALLVGHLWLTRTLRGLPYDFGLSNDEAFDDGNFRRRLETDPNLSLAACGYWIRRLQVCAFMNDHAAALEASTEARAIPWIFPPVVELADYHLYSALARAGLFENANAVDRGVHMEALAAHHQQLQTWTEECPENFENRAALVGAEIARVEGRDLDAEGLYQQAISSARTNGFIHNEALACETAARFYAVRGLEDVAEMYLVRARDGYRRWGADGVVRRLEARYPWLAAADPRDRADEAGEPDDRLDVAVVVKASQALSSEILLPRLVERLMTIALQSAGADRGLLILPDEGGYRVEAAARADGEAIALQNGLQNNSAAPESLIRYAMRTRETVILDDATSPHLFSDDPDLALRRPRSVLCLPLVRRGALVGLLYLENTLASHVFTPERARLLGLLASQAAISLENARLYADLELQVGLLQQLPVSAWTLEPDGTPDFVNQIWLEFSGQTPDFIRSQPEAWMTAIHPEDREAAARSFWEGVTSGQDFAFESRSLRAKDGTYRRHLQQAVVLRSADGQVLKFVGTTTDIDDQKRAEETLRLAQSDLAHVARVATLNAMTASIAHEVSQPLSGILTNASTGLRLLSAEPPNVTGAIETTRRTIRDANRASEVLKRLRAMSARKEENAEIVDLNDAAREVMALSASELHRRGAITRADFADDLPCVSADRVQLQQVILNLLLNAADAMGGVEDRSRTLLVRTELESDGAVRLEVRDAGTGFDPATVEKLFEPFHTTKADGMGVGLSICRSIIDNHKGRLWATPNDGPGATFSFSIPVAADADGAPRRPAAAGESA